MIKHIFILLLIASCSPCPFDEDDMISELDKLNRIKEELTSSDLKLKVKNNLVQISTDHPEIRNEIVSLNEELGLCTIEYYQDLGLAFKFRCDTDKPDCNYYMLYAINPEDREEFAEYEQFVDYRVKRLDYDDHWTFIKIIISYD